MDEDKYSDIMTEATKRYEQWNRRGVSGQQITPKHSFDYWIAEVAYELACEESYDEWFKHERAS